MLRVSQANKLGAVVLLLFINALLVAPTGVAFAIDGSVAALSGVIALNLTGIAQGVQDVFGQAVGEARASQLCSVDRVRVVASLVFIASLLLIPLSVRR